MQDIKQRVALTSIAASGGLTLAKGVVGLATGSLAILSEAAHSLLDLAATIMTYFAVRVSGRPADAEQRGQQGTQSDFSNCALTSLPRPEHSGTCDQNRTSASECQQWLS
jgi:Cation efflux family